MVSDSDCTLLQITKLIYTDGDGLPPDDCYIKATQLHALKPVIHVAHACGLVCEAVDAP